MSENQTPARFAAVDEVLNTIGYDGFVRSLFNRSGDVSKDFTHAVLGIATEVCEIRAAKEPVNRLEEGGDLTFYGVALGQVIGDHLGMTLAQLADLDPADFLADDFLAEMEAKHFGSTSEVVDLLINELLDISKRWIGYGKAPADPLHALNLGLWVISATVADAGFFGAPDLLICANIGKLLERYKGMTFSAEHAVNRDLAAERSVLEHAAAA